MPYSEDNTIAFSRATTFFTGRHEYIVYLFGKDSVVRKLKPDETLRKIRPGVYYYSWY
jgi:hypothetical protein